MRNRGGQSPSIDCSDQRLTSSEEIDLAIYAVLSVAFGAQSPSERATIQAMLPENPTVIELVDAVFTFRRHLGPIPDERMLRAQAGTVMALFLLLGSWVRKVPAGFGESSSAMRSLGSSRSSIPLAEA